MNIYPYVFSNNSKFRITRHVIFWLCWIAYFATYTIISWMSVPHPLFQKIFAALFEVTISTPMDMIYCYSIIYFLLPKFLFRGKYLWFTFFWIFFSFLFVIAFRLYSFEILPHIRSFTGMPLPDTSSTFIWFFFYVFSQINMEGCLAAAIKLGKLWFIKQQELDLMKSEKQNIEPKFAEGVIQPVFLINAVNKIESLAIEKPAAVPLAIQKIKNILLYVIYDSSQARVNVETEIKLLEDYITLEKIAANGNLNINLQKNLYTKDAKIAPSILLPIVENCLKQLSSYNIKEKKLDIQINLDDNIFFMEVKFTKPMDTSNLMNDDNAIYLNVSKRLNLLYLQSHDFKVIIEAGYFIIKLRMNLQAAMN